MLLVQIFNSTPFEFGMGGATGFNYLALKDAIKWRGMSCKKYVPVLISCFNYFIKGKNSISK